MQIDRRGTIAMPGRRVSGVAPPQFEFFFVDDEQVVTPLDFDDYEEEIRTLLKKLGGYEQMDVPLIRKIFGVHLIHDIKYDPRQHTRDIILHREMKNKCAS
jgi:hypothetical protein